MLSEFIKYLKIAQFAKNVLPVLYFQLAVIVLPCYGQLISKADCGKSKGCFFQPENCDPASNCVYALTYHPTAQQTIAFELQAMFEDMTSPAHYVAVAFSEDNQMVN